jgi:DNA invertase Pin-like site-specific DNA recombinase
LYICQNNQKMEKFIGYVRTSTTLQNLGLKEQERQLRDFVKRGGGELVDLVVEQDSGKKSDRVGLLNCLELCNKNGYTLLFTKLDRLSREVEFLFKIRDKGVKLKCLELPELNTLTLGIFGTMGQYERELISERTKKSLNELKQRGVKLGKPENLTMDSIKKGQVVRKENSINDENWLRSVDVIENYMNKHKKVHLTEISNLLNKKGYKTRTGKEFKPITVKRVIEKYNLVS